MAHRVQSGRQLPCCISERGPEIGILHVVEGTSESVISNRIESQGSEAVIQYHRLNIIAALVLRLQTVTESLSLAGDKARDSTDFLLGEERGDS